MFLDFRLESELRDAKKIIDLTVKSVIDTGADLSESGNYETSKEFMGVLKDLIKLDRMIVEESAFAHDFTTEIRTKGDVEAVETILKKFSDLNAKDSRIKWKNVTEIKEYTEITWECGPGYGNKFAYPVIEEDEEAEEEDGIVMQSRDSLICPISQGLLKDPVRNSTCKHSYSKSMILELFRNAQTIQCPVSGCPSTVTRRELLTDENLERKLKRAENRIF